MREKSVRLLIFLKLFCSVQWSLLENQSGARSVAWFPFKCEANFGEDWEKKKERKKKCELGVFPSRGWRG